jgi:hypothetical protein
MAGMKPQHAAALALVWYLLMAPTFRNPQTDSFTIDLNAPLSAWQLASSYYSGADCELAERDLWTRRASTLTLSASTPYASPATIHARWGDRAEPVHRLRRPRLKEK